MTTQNGNSDALLITIVQPNPAEMPAMGHYAQESGKVASQYGAEILVKFNVTQQLHGNLPAAIVGIAKFDSAERIKEMFSSEAYQKLVPMRDKGVQSLSLYISQPGQTVAINGESEGKPLLLTLAAPNPNEMEALGQYQQGAGLLSGKYGAKPVTKIGIAENFIGDTPAAFLSVAAFENEDAAKGFFSDEAYQPLIPLRDKALSSLNLYLAN